MTKRGLHRRCIGAEVQIESEPKVSGEIKKVDGQGRRAQALLSPARRESIESEA